MAASNLAGIAACYNCRGENDDSAEAVALDGEGGVYVAGTIGIVQEVLH
jgi:hypothetical protein